MPLATKVDGCVGDAKIAEMWKCHYKSLLNSVQSGNSKNSVMLDVNKQIKNSITITPFDILDALKNIKCGKSSGIDGISAEHFVFAHSHIHVLLSLLFSAFITHGYLPGMFMKTAIVPIIKNKTGDTSDKNNYRPIALVTAASKIFEIMFVRDFRKLLVYTRSTIYILHFSLTLPSRWLVSKCQS